MNLNNLTLLPMQICASLPADAQAAVDTISGYVLGAIVVIIALGVVVSFGAMGLGRLLHMPQVTKGGTVSLVVTAVIAVLLPVVYLIITQLWDGCIG